MTKENEPLINLKNIPIGCLYNTMSRLQPSKLALVSQTKTENEDFSSLCLSNSLWKNLYSYHFRNFQFKTTQKYNDINWMNRFAKRYAIASNIKTNKPKVKSFPANDKQEISKICTLANAFAFNTSKEIRLVVYDYLDNECLYEEKSKFVIDNKDFIFLGSNTMVSVGSSVVLYDINKNDEISRTSTIRYQVVQPNDPNTHTHLQNIDETSFAMVFNRVGTIYDTRERMFDSRCHFLCDENVIATASENNSSNIYVATPCSITAFDTRGARGNVLWKKHFANDNSPYCDFNMDYNMALLGNRVIDLKRGRSVAFYRPEGARYNRQAEMPIHGAIANDKNAIFGFEKKSLVLFNYDDNTVDTAARRRIFADDDDALAANTGKVTSTFEFADGGIKSIAASPINNIIAVAADYSIKLIKVPKNKEGDMKDIRSVTTGSMAVRKRGEIAPIKQVVFDGERLITNMVNFVRVYDFYTGKKAKK